MDHIIYVVYEDIRGIVLITDSDKVKIGDKLVTCSKSKLLKTMRELTYKYNREDQDIFFKAKSII